MFQLFRNLIRTHAASQKFLQHSLVFLQPCNLCIEVNFCAILAYEICEKIMTLSIAKQ